MTRWPRETGAIALVVGSACAWGCAMPQSPVHVPDTTVFDGTREPMQYKSPLPRDVHLAAGAPPEATGVACSTTIAFPPLPPALFYGSEAVINALPWPSFTIGAGNRGYALAMERAHAAAGTGTLFDVRADVHTTSLLGIWRRDCIEVHAAVARAAPQ
jgi:hypothetical protein